MKNPLLSCVAAVAIPCIPVSEYQEPPGSAPDAASEVIPSTPHDGFEVHEWGTFTSLQGSNGVALPGMHRDDEALPDFVHRRAINAQAPKGLEGIPEGVTQKMETPVLYFYSPEPPEPMDVSVRVDFPQGLISEWYPQSSGWGPEWGNVANPMDGWMQWHVTLDSKLRAWAQPHVEDNSIWAPSRQVASTPLSAGKDAEQFIFYRGVGRFDLPVQVRTDGCAAEYQVQNLSESEELRGVFLLDSRQEQGRFLEMDAVAAHTRWDAWLSGEELVPRDEFIESLGSALAARLVEAGLFADEAWALVNTWSRSYFETPGVRLLYIVPRAWTDALLPIQISPTPDTLTRVLVGRIEVFPAFEERLLQSSLEQLRAADPDPASPGVQALLQSLGRLAEPKLFRIAELVQNGRPDPEMTSYLQDLIWAVYD